MRRERGSCSVETLASGPVGRVQMCSCGSVHISVGAVTLRTDVDDCASLAQTLAEAVIAMAARRPALRVVHGDEWGRS